MSTKILTCTCTNSYQDNLYGKQKRVMNEVLKLKQEYSATFRCTVCGKEVKVNNSRSR